MPRAPEGLCDLGQPVQSSGSQQSHPRALLLYCPLSNATCSVVIPKIIPKLIYTERSFR